MQSVATITEGYQQGVGFLYDLEKVQALRKFFGGLRQDVCKIIAPAKNPEAAARLLLDLRLDPDKAEYGLYHGRVPAGGERQQLSYTVTTDEKRLAQLLYYHVNGDLNVCQYFDQQKNSVLCFNIDLNRQYYDTYGDPTDEMIQTVIDYTVRLIMFLRQIGLDPLVLETGNGCHVWIRFTEPIDNAELRIFAKNVEKVVNHGVLVENLITDWTTNKYLIGGSIPALDIAIHPLPSITEKNYKRETVEKNSLRLPLTIHASTGKFTGFIENGRFLSEKESLDRLKNYKSATVEQFNKAKDQAEEWANKKLI